jgi:large subunit ribosomal protein L10Ae
MEHVDFPNDHADLRTVIMLASAGSCESVVRARRVTSNEMSKLSREALTDGVKSVLKYSNEEKKRAFVETCELQISLKGYDPVKDKRFAGSFRLPHVPRAGYKVAIMADAKHEQEAKAAGIPVFTENDLKKLNKNKKAIKKLCSEYDAFLASASLIRRIPRIVGPGLNKAGKFPSVLGTNDNIVAKVEDAKATIKFQLKSKKTVCMGVAIGNVKMTEQELVNNISSSANYLVSLLPKNWQQIKRLYIKSSMGPPQRIFGF